MLPPVPAGREVLEELAGAIRVCVQCPLNRSRTLAVPGEGPAPAPLFLVGEAPGRKEDESGRPFVGPSGRVLNQALEAAGVRREEVYITSSVKCRPPGGANPKRSQVSTCCNLYLYRQIEAVGPRVLVTLGNFGLQALLGWGATVGEWRGRKAKYKGIPVVATYHPAASFRNPRAALHLRADLRRAVRLARGAKR